MARINLIMILLPFVFMVHEYEEIIMFRRWIDRNREELRKRFPKIESFFTRRGVFDYSTSTFAVGTAHVFANRKNNASLFFSMIPEDEHPQK